MKKQSAQSRIKHLVPNNPEYDRASKDPAEVTAERRAIQSTLYDSSYKTAAGHWKRRDEPGEPKGIQYLKIAPDALRKQKQWDARQRLKNKNAVPTKQGKKLFEQFMRDANVQRPQALHQQVGISRKDLSELENLYNAASVLEFEQWMILVVWLIGKTCANQSTQNPILTAG